MLGGLNPQTRQSLTTSHNSDVHEDYHHGKAYNPSLSLLFSSLDEERSPWAAP